MILGDIIIVLCHIHVGCALLCWKMAVNKYIIIIFFMILKQHKNDWIIFSRKFSLETIHLLFLFAVIFKIYKDFLSILECLHPFLPF